MPVAVFIQIVCQAYNVTVIQIEVCQRLASMVLVNSSHYSNEDHVELEIIILCP